MKNFTLYSCGFPESSGKHGLVIGILALLGFKVPLLGRKREKKGE